MLVIKKSDEGRCLASLTGKIPELDRNRCADMKKELTPLMKAHREITIDLKGVRPIHKGGIRILEDLVFASGQKKCSLKFIHAETGYRCADIRTVRYKKPCGAGD